MVNFTIRTYHPDDAVEVIALWGECGLIVPWNNPQADIDRKYADSPHLFFVGELKNELVASCMAGYDGHRGWIYFLAVKNSKQRKGLATTLVDHVEAVLVKLGCPKVELMVRKTILPAVPWSKRRWAANPTQPTINGKVRTTSALGTAIRPTNRRVRGQTSNAATRTRRGLIIAGCSRS